MKNIQILFFVFLLGVLNTVGASIRTTYNFNPDWKIFIGEDSTAKKADYNDSKWKSVNLPAAFNEKEAFKVPVDQLTDTVAWYRKTFCIPSEHKGQKVFIEFEGARQSAEVWVNGQWVGLHENGVMAFGFDLTKYVKFGKKKNVIAVRVDHSPKYKERATGSPYQWNDNAFKTNYGGLTKNVFLHLTDKLYQTLPLYSNLKTKGVYVYADHFDIKGKRAILHIESEVRNEYDRPKTMKINVMVRDKEKLLVREFQSEEVTLQPGETKVITVSASMRNLQFWSWGFGYLYEVNTSITMGKKVMDLVRIHTGFRETQFTNGVFKLNDRALQLKGYAQPSGNDWPGVGPSVPAWLSDYSNNLMVESNANLVRWMYVTPWKQDVESCDRVGLIETMPAGDAGKDVDGRMWEQRKELMRDAIIYNRNNPSIIFYESGNSGISEAHLAEMKAIRDEFDPNGGRAVGCTGMLDSKVAEYGGDRNYVDKSSSKPVFSMEYGRDERLCNQDMFAMETVARWYDFWRERPGTGRRVNSGGASAFFSDSNTPFLGAENDCRSGKVDAMRIKKEAWWAHDVMWDGWVDSENFNTHIVGHWNDKEGVRKNVYVISSG
ncbi:MAG: beta-galactosidase, partial [Bacteroidales bacterium]|nr:beta-galactosidase [Bacteroidales bacterium]